MTVEPSTRTLETPGATVVYDVRGPLPAADGRPPLLIAPAQCRSADFRDASSLPGLGVLALTEQAVFYSSGERVVIMSREGLHLQGKGNNLDFVSQVPSGRLVVTLPDPDVWRAAFAE